SPRWACRTKSTSRRAWVITPPATSIRWESGRFVFLCRGWKRNPGGSFREYPTMDRYDFIVVGAGSAGCVVASRLTEDAGTRVLVLEAGGSDRLTAIRVPAAFSTLFRGPCDWNFQTVEQPRLEGRKLYWPRGKVLGGSSSLNAMIYVRGHPSDYDHWKE